ncbi:Transglutaminase-like superfamily protein [Planctomycetes bacterium Pan216]|uniref:Transglutaminase-like superfamily protein n=1 Tax=Kolteria novifilia TaxID=2527975 RepID=A0A518BBS6_9BACT|nr:Transglutaminase-like superfamily protein [Planctomycetes bacterium Pan216]
MTIRVALHHKTTYKYDRLIGVSPQIVRLRPAPHSRTPINSYSLKISPSKHFVNWQQDPQGNYLARLIFNEKIDHFDIQVDLTAEMTVINPFDFFLESSVERYPFEYADWLASELKPFRELVTAGPKLNAWLESVRGISGKTVDVLVELNQRLQKEVSYLVRMEPGVQTCEETLTKGSGSCRDSAWLLVQILRHLGMAARFVSGYLIQLSADVKPLDGPEGPENDFTDLHAWAEVYLPGAGWVGLDPTSGLLAGEGHIPLACTPEPASAAPITGSIGECNHTFDFAMSVKRIHEDPRVTKPYTEETWRTIELLGHDVDRLLLDGDVRLTMGGEPTFVSVDDMESPEWTTEAVGPTKLKLATSLLYKLKDRFSTGGLLHFGQGKWYPGEPLPRWALRCYWRRDQEPIWRNPDLLADPNQHYGHDVSLAERFSTEVAQRLAVNPDHVSLGYEDVLYYAWKERRLPSNVNVHDSKLEDEQERARLAKVFEQGITSPIGCVLPLQFQWWLAEPCWRSGLWPVRSEELFLVPGDSPMGLRLPLESLTWVGTENDPALTAPLDPLAPREPLPLYDELRRQHSIPGAALGRRRRPALVSHQVGGDGGGDGFHEANGEEKDFDFQHPYFSSSFAGPSDIIRTALCVEPRDGRLHVFMPPTERLEAYLHLVAAVEETAEALGAPVVIEGYLPPHDQRINHLSLTPDPGVIEVNVQPAHDWDELVGITTGIYEDAHQSRLGTEKFDQDGTHTGTGGGNHVVLGGPSPADSPFLRRPDLLRSLVGYWHNHPSLSYLFSGKFVGPTSQAPRVDEGRRDAIYELQIAFEQVPDQGTIAPWVTDRVFRNLLVDLTGNTHRSEFCIDKLFSPESSTGRLGLVEFRAFEMPPHARMSLTQQLLLRGLVARFWNEPYRDKLVEWGTGIHDRFLLPHFLKQDFEDVVEETNRFGLSFDTDWFAPHFEFRFPKIGEIAHRGVHLELREAIEPWYVLGEQNAMGGTSRYVDSSVERMQVKVSGMADPRHLVTCNGRQVPLQPTGTVGEFVAGVRYRAWQPPSCLHPTIPVDEPLIFDILDTWLHRSLGGCRYYVGHPGGLNPESFPVNANEAESRRAARFADIGHTGGTLMTPNAEHNPNFPFTLDLRRGRANAGG